MHYSTRPWRLHAPWCAKHGALDSFVDCSFLHASHCVCCLCVCLYLGVCLVSVAGRALWPWKHTLRGEDGLLLGSRWDALMRSQLGCGLFPAGAHTFLKRARCAATCGLRGVGASSAFCCCLCLLFVELRGHFTWRVSAGYARSSPCKRCCQPSQPL
jgi:hypothetical protein